MRLEIPAHADMWARGARFGDVVKVTTARHPPTQGREIAHVRLDKAPRRIYRYWLDECREVGAALADAPQ